MTANDDRESLVDSFYHDLFDVDKRGQAVFEDLYQRFYARSRVHTSGGIDAILKTYQAAAHKEVMDYIISRINKHNGVHDSVNDHNSGASNE